MTAGKHNFICEQGATFIQNLFYRDTDDVAIDISGYSARMKVKDTFGGTELDSYTSGNEITITGATGAINITVADDVTSAYTPGLYIYDLEIESAGGVTYRILQGSFEVLAEVTV